MKQNIKPTIVLGTICLAVALLLSAINMVTSPIIEAQRNAAANEALLVVLPDGEGFEELDISALALPDAVVKAWKETTGKGYVFQMSVAGYQPGLVIMCGVDAEGKITGSKYLESNETYGLEAKLDQAYNGKTIENAELIIAAGASNNSATSKAYYEAVKAALQANVIVSGGKLDDSIVLEEMILKLAPGFVSTEKVDASGNITKAYKAKTDAGFAYIVKSGDASVLALVNATGACKVYDAEGNDVTANNAAVVAEAVAHASANQKSYKSAAETKFGRMIEGATDMTALELNTFGTVVYAASFKVDDATYYGFYSRSVGFEQMDVYVVIDADGAIVKVDAKAIFFETEYFPIDDNVNEKEYKNSFTGLTPDTFTGDNAMIAGATMTSNAMKQSVNDAFDAFKTINKGGAN